MSSLTVPFRPSDLPTGLVAYWKFNNNGTDSSGSGYDLTGVNTPAYAVDDYWKSGEYSCDIVAATPTYFSRASNTDLDLLGSFTIAYWAKPDDASSVSHLDNDGNALGYRIWQQADTTVQLYVKGADVVTSTGLAPLGKWTHLAFVYDQTTASIYINGNLNASAAASTNNTGTSSTLVIGVREDLSSNPYDGHIKDLAIWSSALTPIQIKSLAMGVDLSTYAYRPNNVSVAPTAWWKMSDVTHATDVLDSSGNSHTATKTGWVENTYSGGYIEGAGLDFERGDTEHLVVGDHADWDITGDFTIGGWYKFETSGSNGLMSHYKDADEYWMWAFDSDTLKFRTDNAGDDTTVVSYAWTVPLNTWLHIALTRSGNTWTTYVDGVAVDSDTSAQTVYGGTGDLTIGYATKLNQYYDGVMSDIFLTKGYACTAAEIASLACALPIQQQGIVLYSKMNAASGSETTEIGGFTLVDSGAVGTGVGKVGNARDFEGGTPDTFTIANASQGNLNISATENSGVSVLAWIKPESSGAVGYIVDNDVADNYALVLNTANSITAFVDNTGDTSSLLVADGTWGHVAMVWDGATVYAIVNSVFTSGTAKTSIVASDLDFVVGARSDGFSSPFDGLIDELLVARYFRAEEIKAVYIKGANGKEATSTEVTPTDIKSVNGLAYTSIKSRTGLAIASIKSMNGLA